ncbi:MAG: tetratricopeptide repeat protein [Marinilabiliales bacterium]|nr:tetratricopeptide repeat protein [Marinilabiliales bacterium]
MMWEESRENFDNKESAGVFKRYKKMLREKRTEFFDVSDFELIADQYIDNNQYSNALQACEIALRQPPTSILVKIKKAQILLSQLRLDQALSLLKELEEIENANSDVLMMLGTCYNIKGNQRLAKDYFKKAESYAFEEKDELLYNIGIAFIQTSSYEEALIYLRKALEENPEHEPVLYDLAFCFEKVGEDQLAIEYYNKYLDKDPFSESAWYNLGIIFNRQEEYDKAIDAYDFALAIDPGYAAAIFNKANALSALEQFEEAIVAYLEYAALDPDSVEAHLYLADSYFQLEDFENAALCYDKTVRMDPTNQDGWFGAGLVLLINGKYREAVKVFKRALEFHAEFAECRNALAKAYAALEEDAKADREFRKTLELDVDIPEYWLSYSDFLFQHDKLDESVMVLEESADTDAFCPSIQYRLAGLYLTMGNEEMARENLQQALAADFESQEEFFSYFTEFRMVKWINEMIVDYGTREAEDLPF